VKWLQPALRKLQVDLRHFGLRWAMIGGLAVSLRGEPRTTKDLDVAIAVTGNRQAESVVRDFTSRGYRLDAVREHLELKRLVSVGLVAAVPETRGIVVDLMFASSGIEKEVVAASEILEVSPGISLPVATTAHLLALKTLAGRPKDVSDFITLTQHAGERDLLKAREALELIARRGYNRDKDLQAEFVRLLDLASQEL
jgi:predicted nucleotidyltransferase